MYTCKCWHILTNINWVSSDRLETHRNFLFLFMAPPSPSAAIICFLDICGKYLKTICPICSNLRVYFELPSFSCLDFRIKFMHFFDVFTRNSYTLYDSVRIAGDISTSKGSQFFTFWETPWNITDSGFHKILSVPQAKCRTDLVCSPMFGIIFSAFCSASKKGIQIPLETQNKLVVPHSKNSRR